MILKYHKKFFWFFRTYLLLMGRFSGPRGVNPFNNQLYTNI